MRAQQIWNCIYFEKYVGENGRYLLLKTDYRLLLFLFIKYNQPDGVCDVAIL